MWIPKTSWVTPWRSGLIIFSLAFLLRIAIFLLVIGPHPIPSNTELGRIATEVGLHHQFANPYKIPTGPTAHTAPLYPMIQSVWVTLFGNTQIAGTCAVFLNVMFSALAAALLPALAAECRIPVYAGVLAGLFLAMPVSALQELSFFEATLVALLLVVASVTTVRIFTHASFSLWNAIGYGVLWGVVLLASPIAVSVFGGCLLVGLWLNWKGGARRSYLVFAGISLLAATATLLPWTVRNYRELGGLFFVRSDFGLEMKVSNNSDASPLMDTNLSLPYFLAMHPSDNPEEAKAVREVGEKEYNRRALTVALDWIRTHPTQFLSLSVRRFLVFWFTPGWPPWKGLIVIPIVLLAWAGCIRMVLLHPVAGPTLATVPVLFPPVYFIVHTSSRYRFPAYWSIPFFASYAVVSYLRRHRTLRCGFDVSGRVVRKAKVP
jgi:hypothetical protein